MGKLSATGSALIAAACLFAAVSAAAQPGESRYAPPPPPPGGGHVLRGGISFSGGVSAVGDSLAGDDEEFGTHWFIAPDYDDAYDSGWKLRVEPYIDFTPMIRGQIGIVHDEWEGQTYDDGFGPVKFDDLDMTAFYVGVRFRFLPYSRIRPYAVADIGVARFSAVDVTGLHGAGVRTRYWDETDTIYGDVGGGVEFLLNPHLAFFVDLRVQATGEPDSADPPSSDAEGMVTVPITAGVNISF